MMRLSPVAGVAVAAASLTLTTSACSPEEASPGPDEDLLWEYIESNDVRNDRFPSGSDVGPEDRKATFAAYLGGPQDVLNALLSAFLCEGDEDEEAGVIYPIEEESACDVNGAVRNAVRDSVGADAEIWGRSVLVKHDDGSLELITLYVARSSDDGEGGDDGAVLIDGDGETYTGGLDDFRDNNDLLDASDLILAPRNITNLEGGRIVTVSGHTAEDRRAGLVAGIAAIVLLAATAITLDIRRRRRTHPPTPPATPD